MATFHICLTVGPIWLLMSFYKRAPCMGHWFETSPFNFVHLNYDRSNVVSVAHFWAV